MRIPVALTIAGSDSGGGAGVQADIKAMQANGVYATSVLTAITAQNTVAVTDAMNLPVSIIESQIDAVLSDIRIDAAKTGMLSSSDIIRAVAAKIREHEIRPLVVDPVMISKSGYSLLEDDAVQALIDELLPLATVCTPNAHEAARLVGYEILSECRGSPMDFAVDNRELMLIMVFELNWLILEISAPAANSKASSVAT